MQAFRRWVVAVAVGVGLALAGFAATRPSPEERADALLQRLVDGWSDPERRADTSADLRWTNPEWDLMHRTFLALSLVDRAMAHPDEADRWLPVIDDLVGSQI